MNTQALLSKEVIIDRLKCEMEPNKQSVCYVLGWVKGMNDVQRLSYYTFIELEQTDFDPNPERLPAEITSVLVYYRLAVMDVIPDFDDQSFFEGWCIAVKSVWEDIKNEVIESDE